MKILTGKGVCSGVAVGILRYYKENETNIKRVHIEDTEKEIEKLENAKQDMINGVIAKNEKLQKMVDEL